MKKNKLALSIMTLFLCSQTQAENLGNSVKDVKNTDLLSAYQQALTNDPQYNISAANLKATEQNVRISRSNLLPQISASASLNKSTNDNLGSVGVGVDVGSSIITRKADDISYGINLSQSLFDWGQYIAVNQAEMRVRASELNHAATLQNLMLRTSQAYFNVLAAKENLATTRAEKEAFGQQLGITQEQYQSGLAAATDYLNAQSNFDQAVANEVSLTNSLTTAQEALREITGNYYYKLEGIAENMELSRPSPNNIDDWMRVANESNLGLKAQQMNVKVARQEVKRNKSGHYPTASLNWRYSRQDGDSSNSLSPISSDTFSEGHSTSLRVDIPLYSGHRTTALTKQAKHSYLASTHQLEQTARQVQRNTRNAYNNLNAAVSSYQAYKRTVDSGKSSLEATQDGYQAGTRNIIDVLAATRVYYSAQRNLTRAKYDYLINSLNLKQAVGTLTEDDINRVNGWLHKF